MAFEGSRLVIGHRGAAGLQPENTLPSFEKAVELGVDAVELDIHVCEDRLCVIHDSELKRTTNGRGLVADQSLSDLRTLDAGNGARIPFLEEVFDVIPAHVGINVELKGTGTAEPLARLLGDYTGRDLLVSSFRHEELAHFTRLAPDVPVAPLFDRWYGDPPAIARSFNSRFVNISKKLAATSMSQTLRQEGFAVLVYTVNTPAVAEKLFASGVTGVFTDYPNRIRPVARDDQFPGADRSDHR